MDSNVEWLLEALLNGETVTDFTSKSRMEEYLKAILSKSGTENLPIPRSRIDTLLYQLVQSGESEVLQPQTKTVTPTLEAQTITADEGYTLSKVNIEAATDVYDAGIQEERKAMWDMLQRYGTKINYGSLFGGSNFFDQNFKPIYDMKPTVMTSMFANSNSSYRILHLAKCLEECGVTLDTSDCTKFDTVFANSTDIRGDYGTFDIRKNTTVRLMFYFCGSSVTDYVTIRLIVDENTNLSEMFGSSSSVKWLYIEGTIGKSFNLSSLSNLTTECAKTIIETNLKNLVGTDLEGTLSFKLATNVWTNLDTTYPREDGSTWQEYVANALGWTT